MRTCIPVQTTILATIAAAAAATAALAQSAERAAFVANNGNLEGSVSSFVFDPNGAPVLADRVITGARASISEFEPGANAYTISLRPDGRYVATGHAAGEYAAEQITILEVGSDASLTLIDKFVVVPGTPLDVEWIDDTYLAVTRTNVGGVNEIIVYEFDPDAVTLTERSRGLCGDFTTSVTVHPSGQYIYAGDSFDNAIFVFSVGAGGVLTPVETMSTGGTYPLGVTMSPLGDKLYAFGGISSGGNAIIGYFIDPDDGTLSVMPESPFTSPGASPKDGTLLDDGSMLFAAHGTDATARSFDVDAETGTLSSTGHFFDVGLQGTLGDVRVLDDLLLVTDNSTALDDIRGLYSLRIGDDGSLDVVTVTPSEGIGPREIAAWSPAGAGCPTDLDGSGATGLGDLSILLSVFGLCDGDAGFEPAADFDGSGCIDLTDLSILLGVFGTDCPV